MLKNINESAYIYVITLLLLGQLRCSDCLYNSKQESVRIGLPEYQVNLQTYFYKP
jgi:hypothetical protein